MTPRKPAHALKKRGPKPKPESERKERVVIFLTPARARELESLAGEMELSTGEVVERLLARLAEMAAE